MIPYIQYPDLLFSEENHKYTWKNEERPSVTGILSSVARKKKGDWVPIADNRFYSDDGGVASAFGKAFHKASAFNLRGQDFDCPESLWPWYKQFLKWRREYDFLQPLRDTYGNPLIEYPMYHVLLNYCGTGDLFAEAVDPCPSIYRNTVWVADWKTCTQEHLYFPAQTAGYAELLKANFTDLVRGRKIIRCAVRFDADALYPDTRLNNPEDFALFHSALNIYRA